MKRVAILAGTLFLTGCYLPRVGIQSTNMPSGNAVTWYNSAGKGVILIPLVNGQPFTVFSEKKGERSPWCLWLCRERIPIGNLALKNGGAFSKRFWTLDNRTVHIPVAVKVVQNKREVGFYNRCFSMSLNRNSPMDFNFTRQMLYDLKRGDTGRPCGGRGEWW